MHITKPLQQLIFIFLLLIVTKSNAQTASGSFTGKITSNDGIPAVGVTVRIKEINKSSLTNELGLYRFNTIKAGKYTLLVTFVGLQPQQQSAEITAGEATEVNFTLAENASRLAEVVITASNYDIKKSLDVGKGGIQPIDLPQSVQIINSEVLADQQANRLSDVMKNVNGVALGADRGSVSGETFYARGYSLGTNNVFKNGVRASSGGLPETSSLESVEVLKGSAALLYGGISGGAVVNMVTKKPKFNYGGEISMRSGSYDLYKPSGDIYGPISKNLAFRLIGTHENAASFRNNVKANRLYINPSFLYKAGKNTEILVQGDYLKSNYTPDFGIGTVGNQIADIGRRTFLNTNWTYNNTSTFTSQARVDHKINKNWKLNAVIALQEYNRNYYSTERPAAAATGDWKRVLTRSKNREFTYNQQINLNGSFNTGSIAHAVLIGGDADQSNVDAYGYSNPNDMYDTATKTYYYDQISLLDLSKYSQRTDIPNAALSTDTKTSVYRMGVFIQDMLTLTSKVKVLAGIRYSFQKMPRSSVYNYAKDETTIATNGIDKSKTEGAYSPKLGLIYQPFKSSSVYLSYANNFTSNTGIDILTSAPMEPSIIDQYEAGIKNDFMNGKLSVNVTWYKIVNNKFAQTALFKPDGSINSDTNLKEFTGETASDGIETDITGHLAPGLNMLAGYSYNYMRYTKTRDEAKTASGALIAGGIVEGERLVGTTKHTANATLFYTLQSGKLKGLKMGSSLFYTGDRNGGRNTNKSGTSTGIIPLNGFTTFDISAGYSFKKLSVLGKMSNITNELNYFVHENYSVNPIAPRQFITTLAYKF